MGLSSGGRGRDGIEHGNGTTTGEESVHDKHAHTRGILVELFCSWTLPARSRGAIIPQRTSSPSCIANLLLAECECRLMIMKVLLAPC